MESISTLAPGASAWTFLLQPTGKVDVFARVTRRADGFVLDTDGGYGDALVARLRRYDEVRIRPSETRYLEPLLRDAEALKILAGPGCRIVLLGSIASARYVEPLLEIFGERLLFPATFAGRGDMSRGGLLLRCARTGSPLDCVPVRGAVRHGPKPPKLPRLKG